MKTGAGFSFKRGLMKRINGKWMLLAGGTALIASSSTAADDWTRNFRIGMTLGLNIHADFKMGGAFPLSGKDPGPMGVSGANHEFDDGYVRVDETGNAQGLTSYWGYQNVSQYDAGAQTMTFHTASALSTSATSVQRDDSPYIGFDMAYGGQITRWGRARVGWELGVGILPISIKDTRNLPATFQNASYNADVPGGVIPPGFPDGSGNYNGGPSGIGANLFDTITPGSVDSIPGTITGPRKLDVTLYSFRLGPTLYWNLHPRWAVNVSAGPALGIVAGDYKFNETDILSTGETLQTSGKFGKIDLVYGGYANGNLLYHLEPHGDLFAGVQFMSLSSSTFRGPGREANLNLGAGFYFTAGVNWPF